MAVLFWIYGASRMRAEVNDGASVPMGPWWEFCAKYIAVGGTLFILIGGTLRYFGLWK